MLLTLVTFGSGARWEFQIPMHQPKCDGCPQPNWQNVVEASINCPMGKIPDGFGRCKDVQNNLYHLKETPVKCLQGQFPDAYGRCEYIWNDDFVYRY